MFKFIRNQSELIEQASFSGFRYLFWISIPLLFPSSLSFIATLTIVNLLNSSLYSTFVGTPSFYILSKISLDNIKKSFLPILTVIVGTSFFSTLLLIFFYGIDFIPEKLLLIFLFVFVSAFSDWNRKISLLKKEIFLQSIKNIFGIVLWCLICSLQFFEVIEFDYLQIIFLFVILNFSINVNFNSFSTSFPSNYLSYFEKSSVLKHYLVVAIISYLSGNILFYLNKTEYLDLFLVLRNYLTPIIVLSLYIETHGAIEFQSNEGKRTVFFNQIIKISLISIIFYFTTGIILNIIFKDFNLLIFICACIITVLATLIKIPTVILRLLKREFLITKTYYFSILFILPIFFFKSLLPFQGLELIVLSYLFTFILLSIFFLRFQK